jgi:hypothetical protein
MLPRRIAWTLAIGLTAVALLGGAATKGETGAAPSAAPPVALIDLGGIFGDENEADEDENEPEEDAGSRQQSPQGARTSPLSVLLAVVAGLVGLGVLARQVRLLRGR